MSGDESNEKVGDNASSGKLTLKLLDSKIHAVAETVAALSAKTTEHEKEVKCQLDAIIHMLSDLGKATSNKSADSLTVPAPSIQSQIVVPPTISSPNFEQLMFAKYGKSLEFQSHLSILPRFEPSGKLDPVSFLNTFESYTTRNGIIESDRITLLLATVNVSEAYWLRSAHAATTFANLKEAFLECFWSRSAQAEKYHAFTKMSFYTLSPEKIKAEIERWLLLLSSCKKLQLSEPQILQQMEKKMPREWQASFQSQDILTTDDFLKIVKRCLEKNIPYYGDRTTDVESGSPPKYHHDFGYRQNFPSRGDHHSNRSRPWRSNIQRASTVEPDSIVGKVSPASTSGPGNASRSADGPLINAVSVLNSSIDSNSPPIQPNDTRAMLDEFVVQYEKYGSQIYVPRACRIFSKIGDQDVSVTGDTGAEISIVDANLVDQVRQSSPELVRNLPAVDFPPVTLADGTKDWLIREKVAIVITLDGIREVVIPLFVIYDVPAQVLIGMDVMAAHQVIIDLKQGIIQWHYAGEIITTIVDTISPAQHGISDYISDAKTIRESPLDNNELALFNLLENLPPDQSKVAFQRLRPYAAVFSPELGKYHKPVRFELMEHIPWYKKGYDVPAAMMHAVEENICDLLKNGVIQRSNTPYINPLVAAEKSDGSSRVCIDSEALNDALVDSHYEVPKIQEAVFKENGSKYYSLFDFKQGFHQIELHEESRKYTGFQFKGVVYEYVRLPFGTKVSPSLFIQVITDVLDPLTNPKVTPYVDDILVEGDSFEGHLDNIEYVLQRIHTAGMTLNVKKTKLFYEQMGYLGFVIADNSIAKDPVKFEWFAKFERKHWNTQHNEFRPATRKAIQSLLGFLEFYAAFVPNFEDLVLPFRQLIRESKRYTWSSQHFAAYEKLKQAFAYPISLRRHDPLETFNLHIRVSENNNISACITQFYTETAVEQAVFFYGKTLLAQEQKYSFLEKYMFALYTVVKKFRRMLYLRRLTLAPEFKNLLRQFREVLNFHSKASKWITFLRQFNFSFRSEDAKKILDYIDFAQNSSQFNDVHSYTINYFGVELDPSLARSLNKLPMFQQADDKIRRKITDLTTKSTSRYANNFIIHNEILHHIEGERYLPCLPSLLAKDVIVYLHRALGHIGPHHTYLWLKRFYYVPNGERAVQRALQNYMACLQHKSSNQHVRPEFIKITAEEIGAFISFDQFGPLPVSRGGVLAIIVARDICSKYTWFFPIKNMTATNYVDKLEQVVEFVAAHGKMVQVALSDNAKQFVGDKWFEMCSKLGIEVRHTTKYNPQSSPVERVMKELGAMLRIYVNEFDDELDSTHTRWALCIKDIEATLNETPLDNSSLAPSDMMGVEYREPLFPTVDGIVAWGFDPVRTFANLKLKILCMLEMSTPNAEAKLLSNKPDSENFHYNENDHVIVYTDGACVKNGTDQAVGAIGVWFRDGSVYNTAAVLNEEGTTNNRAELQAVIRGLEIACSKQLLKVEIISDSEYVIKAMNQYIHKWLQKQWKKPNKKPVENADLFQQIWGLKGSFESVIFTHVGGHKADWGNRQADELAQYALATHLCRNLLTELTNLTVDQQKYDEDLPYRQTLYEKYQWITTFFKRLSQEVAYNKASGNCTIYHPGDTVRVVCHNLSDKAARITKKFTPRYEGPYVVIKRLKPNLYLLRHYHDPGKRLVTNVRSLRSCRIDECTLNDDFAEFEVEEYRVEYLSIDPVIRPLTLCQYINECNASELHHLSKLAY